MIRGSRNLSLLAFSFVVCPSLAHGQHGQHGQHRQGPEFSGQGAICESIRQELDVLAQRPSDYAIVCNTQEVSLRRDDDDVWSSRIRTGDNPAMVAELIRAALLFHNESNEGTQDIGASGTEVIVDDSEGEAVGEDRLPLEPSLEPSLGPSPVGEDVFEDVEEARLSVGFLSAAAQIQSLAGVLLTGGVSLALDAHLGDWSVSLWGEFGRSPERATDAQGLSLSGRSLGVGAGIYYRWRLLAPLYLKVGARAAAQHLRFRGASNTTDFVGNEQSGWNATVAAELGVSVLMSTRVILWGSAWTGAMLRALSTLEPLPANSGRYVAGGQIGLGVQLW